MRAAERKSSQRRAPTQLVLNNPGFVIPAKAGIQRSRDRGSTLWAPAFAGTTSAESQAHTCSIQPALQASDNMSAATQSCARLASSRERRPRAMNSERVLLLPSTDSTSA